MPELCKNTSRRKLKIAFHVDGFTTGGLATFVTHLKAGFIERGHEVIFFVNREGPFSDLQSKNSEVYCLDWDFANKTSFSLGKFRFPNPYTNVKNLIAYRRNRDKISRIIQNSNPDCILGNGLYSAVTFGDCCQKLNVPLAVCIHGVGDRKSDFLSIRSRIAIIILSNADSIIGVSNAAIARYIPLTSKKLDRIYNCCPIFPTTNSKPRFLETNGLPPDTVILGSFGQMIRPKGYHVIMNAFKRIEKKYNLILLIGGEPKNVQQQKYLEELKSLSQDLAIENKCFFMGHIEPSRFFSLIDVFCHAYIGEEALSFAILEAMTAGTPVIAVDRGGPKEIISRPELGQLVPPNDPEKLSIAIQKYLDFPDYARNAVEHARKQLIMEFNFEDWPDKWLKLLYRVIELRQRTG